MESSLIRSSALAIFFRYPSCVWVKEMALTTFVFAAVVRLIWLSKRAATATPAASSDGLVILEPELSRDNDFASMSWLDWRLEAAARAWMFVLMTIVCVLYGSCVLVLSGLSAGIFIGQFGNA